ncbi:MAG: hypothetical protein AAGU11_08540, partial [Syntrophobacteraceae bacterium]
MRRSGTACVIAALAMAPWSLWGALALAALGLAVSLPFWLKRSWKDLPESSEPAPSCSAIHPVPLTREEGERLLLREHGARVAPVADPAEHKRKASAKGRVRPQNSFRLAADALAADHAGEKTIPRSRRKEVIHLPSTVENPKKNAQGKSPSGRARVSELCSADAPMVTIDIEEIRWRLTATYGGRMPGNCRDASSPTTKETLRGIISGTRNPRVDTSAASPALPAESSKVNGSFVGNSDRDCGPSGCRRARVISSERDVIIDASRSTGEKFPATGLEGTAMSVKAREAQPLPPSAVPSVRHNCSERDVIIDSSRGIREKFPATGLEGTAMSVKAREAQPLPPSVVPSV